MEYNKTADPATKPIRYLAARTQGKTKADASRLAGYADTNHFQQIEATKTYQIGLSLLQKKLMTVDRIAGYINRNIEQDTDKGASNKAIQIALQQHFPDQKDEFDEGSIQINVTKK